MEHKTAAYRYYIPRMHSLPLNSNKKQKEWNTIQTIAKNNGFPTTFIKRINRQIQHNTNNKDDTHNENTHNIHLLQSTHKKDHKPIQTHKHKNSI